MNPPDVCPECGKPLPPESEHKLCPACLMGQAIASQTVEGVRGNSAPVLAPAEIAEKFPQFEILECLGRGGMGVVYKALQKSLNRLVAIKILAPERGRDPRFATRFASEAELLAKLSHPHIVTIHDFGETGGLYYLVMEYVDGVNLRDLLREGKLEPKQALAIVPEICDALQFAHDHGIIHRDVKPENILLDRLGRVKVADFGLAKLIGLRNEAVPGTEGAGESPNLTEAGKIMGTPSYMAPEQTAQPDAVDHRADIYSLGVVFYQMLTGELPGKGLEAPSRKVHIDVRLDEIVLRALEKNPDLRYSQASVLKTQVETIAAGAGGAAFLGGGRPEEAQARKSEIAPRISSRRTLLKIAAVFTVGAACLTALSVVATGLFFFRHIRGRGDDEQVQADMRESLAQSASNAAPTGLNGTKTREVEGDVGRLYHAIVYTQTSAEAPKLGPTSYQFIADMSNTQFPVTRSEVSLPGGSAWKTNPVAVAKPDSLVGAHYLYVQGFKSDADLIANFPNGSYAFDVQSGGSGAAVYHPPVSFTGSVPYPPEAPVITNNTWDSGSLVLDPRSAIINFTNYPGATLTWEIAIPGRTYIMSAGGGGTSMGELNLSGFLDYGKTYVAQMRFINRDDSASVSDPNSPKDYGYSTMVAQIVEFTIKTPPAPAPARFP